MTKVQAGAGFATRPSSAERWIRQQARSPVEGAAMFSARLTIDVTPAMRRRLKLAAVTRGTTIADLMRTLIDEHFPDSAKEPT